MRRISAAIIALTSVAAALTTNTAQAQTSTFTYSYGGAPLPIFRDGADIITVANLFIPRSIAISKVTVNVDIDYPRPGDLNVYMYSPILTRTKLLERNCGNQGSLTNITFDDSAGSRYSDACPSAPGGTYRGNETLSNYNNQNTIGLWSIAVENNGSNDFIGFLRGYTLTFTGTALTNAPPISAPQAVYNTASYQSGIIAPGELVNIGGANLGPANAVIAPAGNLPTSLGGVQVNFDGTPAALSYVSSNLLVAQVPFGVKPGGTASMTVSYQNSTGIAVPLVVANAVPGIYTQSADGTGVGSVVNPDGSLNSSTHPAARGSYVALYATGLGAVSPALANGQAAPLAPLSTTATPVSAVVDGYPASVTFAGAAPSLVGVYQVNLLIPQLAGSGSRSLSIYQGGAAVSQNLVRIYVQ